MVSSDVSIPCVIGRTIYFPLSFIDSLSQAEFEAIISHELHRVIGYDGLTRTLLSLISTIFWWIPTTWRNRHQVEYHQESACDDAGSTWQITKHDLASAILKSSQWNCHNSPLLVQFAQNNTLKKRLFKIVEEPPTKRFQTTSLGPLTLFPFILMSGKFWIF